MLSHENINACIIIEADGDVHVSLWGGWVCVYVTTIKMEAMTLKESNKHIHTEM